VQLVCIEISSIVPCITNVTCHRASSSWVYGSRFVGCKAFASESVAVTRIGHISQLPGRLAGRVKSGVRKEKKRHAPLSSKTACSVHGRV
jgi:hypothetical protein